MGWSIGFDTDWDRDIGYGVPAHCDHPGCPEEINRGLSFVCGGEPYGQPRGCGLYFCAKHLFTGARLPQLCIRCVRRKHSFKPTADTLEWMYFKMTDPSWKQWRKDNGLEEVPYYHHLMNLLAVIHRDGGHYVEEHGLEKAVEDAINVVYAERFPK